MARDINLNDPASWDDDDKAYLRERYDRVPEQHRHVLDMPITRQTPVESILDVTAASAELDKLARFISANFPDEVGTPVEVAIRLLTEDDDDGSDDPAYESWKGPELKAEVERRREDGRTITVTGNTKADYAAALREDDELRLADGQ